MVCVRASWLVASLHYRTHHIYLTPLTRARQNSLHRARCNYVTPLGPVMISLCAQTADSGKQRREKRFSIVLMLYWEWQIVAGSVPGLTRARTGPEVAPVSAWSSDSLISSEWGGEGCCEPLYTPPPRVILGECVCVCVCECSVS